MNSSFKTTNREFISSISLPEEEWRDVFGYEDRYAVSSLGRIISYNVFYKQNNYLCKKSCRVKKQTPNPRGYLTVYLSNGNKEMKRFLVHRLVATAFLQNPDKLPYVNHKDENPKNNSVSNLEWCTHRYNMNYGTCIQRMRKSLMENSPSKKPVVQLSRSGDYIQTYSSIAEASRSVGSHDYQICRCCSGKEKTAKNYKWMYLSDYKILSECQRTNS